MTSNLRSMSWTVTLLALAMSVGHAQVKPTVPTVMIVDYPPPPIGLPEAVHDATAVVVGSIRDGRTYQPPIDGASIRTAYTLTITDVISSNRPLPPSVELYRYGGDVDEGDHVRRITEHLFPSFAPGHQYVLFLLWNDVLKGFELKFGPDGTYEVLPNGRVASVGRSSLARANNGRDLPGFVNDLKIAAGRP